MSRFALFSTPGHPLATEVEVVFHSLLSAPLTASLALCTVASRHVELKFFPLSPTCVSHLALFNSKMVSFVAAI